MEQKEKIIKSIELLKTSWGLYIANVAKFIMVFLYGLVGVVPMLVILILFFIYNATGLAATASVSANVIFGIIGFILFIASIYLAIIYSIRTKVASILLLKNNFTPAKDNFKEAKPYFVKFLGISLLTAVLIIAWGFVFIIPAIIFGIYYSFASYILIVENKRPFSAIEKSYDLVRGFWWPVFGRLLLVSLIGALVFTIISWPMSYLSEGSTASIIYSVFMNAVWAVLAPYFMVYFYQLYLSLKQVNK